MSDTEKILSELHLALDKYIVANGGKIISIGSISIEITSETAFVISVPVSGLRPTQLPLDARNSTVIDGK